MNETSLHKRSLNHPKQRRCKNKKEHSVERLQTLQGNLVLFLAISTVLLSKPLKEIFSRLAKMSSSQLRRKAICRTLPRMTNMKAWT